MTLHLLYKAVVIFSGCRLTTASSLLVAGTSLNMKYPKGHVQGYVTGLNFRKYFSLSLKWYKIHTVSVKH